MSLYALNVAITGASTGAYYSVSLTQGTIEDGVGQTMPTQAAFTYMSFQGSITFQVPPGDTSCGGTVEATTAVAGSVIASPAINVPVVITLWGRGSILGTYNLPAGQSSGSFNFSVNAEQAIPPSEFSDTMKQIIKPPQ